MPYITHIHVEHCRNVRNLDLDLSVPAGDQVPAFRHLILTGPNGSGKSGVIEEVASKMLQDVLDPGLLLEMEVARLADARVRAEIDPPSPRNGQSQSLQQQHISPPQKSTRLNWNISTDHLRQSFSGGEMIAAYIPARRLLAQQHVPGPSNLELGIREVRPGQSLASKFLQFLVNRRTEMAYATADGDQDAAARIGAWFAAFEHHLRRIMEDDGLVLDFDRASFTFRFRKSDGYTFDLQTLADGHAAILALLAELLIRVHAAQQLRKEPMFEPEGVVLVDEIETHLHLKLQEDILPFLTELFPKLQFLVATHSPAVIASIPNAIVYDFGNKSITLSDHLRGVRYGTLMTEHFGTSSDIDLDSTEKLLELRRLSSLPSPTADEEQRLKALAATLAERSPTLATEVWMIKECLGETNGRPVPRRDS